MRAGSDLLLCQSRFSRVRHVDFRSRTPQFKPTPGDKGLQSCVQLQTGLTIPAWVLNCHTISLDYTRQASLMQSVSWLADGGPFALDEPPSMRTLTLELCTQPTVDLSGCVNLRALNLTLWKVISLSLSTHVLG